MKSGFIGLIGRPNVGKSTLVNTIVGKKVAIVSDKPQTTRNSIWGIYNEDETQMVFVDTPGIHKPNHKLGKYLNKQAYYSIDDVDIVLLVVDGSEALGAGDKYVIDKLQDINKPVILVINKIDKLSNEKILLKITEYKDLYNFSEIVPISALKKDNTDRLIMVLKGYLKDNMKYFDDDSFTNRRIDFLIREIVREKVFMLTDEEVPHSLTTVLETIEKNKNSYNIYVTIIIDREALKKIIVGKNGSKIKKIGTLARQDIEELLGKKIYLNLFVKTIKNWRDKEKYLTEFGFDDFE